MFCPRAFLWGLLKQGSNMDKTAPSETKWGGRMNALNEGRVTNPFSHTKTIPYFCVLCISFPKALRHEEA